MNQTDLRGNQNKSGQEVPEELAFALLKWFVENDGYMIPLSSLQ